MVDNTISWHMRPSVLDSEIKFIPGVGPKRAQLLEKELGIRTFKDLLYTFPFRYVDRSKFYLISELHPDMPYIQLKGKFVRFETVGNGRSARYLGYFSDGRSSIEVVWFQGVKWVKDKYKIGVEYVLFGKPTAFNGKLNIAHPEIEQPKTEEGIINTAIHGVYSSTEKLKDGFLSTKAFSRIIATLLQMTLHQIDETLPEHIVKQLKLLPLREALLNIHFPKNSQLLAHAVQRLKFEELFYIQLNLLKQKVIRERTTNGLVCKVVGDKFNTFYSSYLPFPLTGAQKRVIKEMRADMGSGRQMNRLLQGDVGSGKTLVALMMSLIASDNGYQVSLMAPTEILANQHYESITGMLKDMPVKVALLTGSTRKKARTAIHEGLLSGEINILIGTHALIEDVVQFSNLGLVIIDEQHRFGVMQRAKLWTKNHLPPHILVMSATPIPRTLAMTIYGDLEVSVIDELPPGRKPITTMHFTDSQRRRLFGFMKEQIDLGRQVYVVYPLIKESEKMDYKDLEDGYESITRAFPLPEYQTVVLHGKMKAEDKDISMNQFASGKAHIMVATTVIEVGVNVPNASVMVIESSERFGLSQLHQLRGRVGRGAEQSYCILMSGYKLSKESKKRLDTMVATNDGFEIAEADLKLRGPGDLEGTQQSGIPFDLKIANLAKDGQLLQYARRVAEEILEEDPTLAQPQHAVLRYQLQQLSADKAVNLKEIS
ncbi:ATP-dependent DNA helicase RecG [Acetobacteroides hydrogenigenes]|uniref:ATP-dependent DNA helicase RecG n=2 Tax=Acetobacteroides hydrogenigenes TaxID=979970 RepID=A0A4R2EH27_9BACT|nr:ATP-dependent DNA helicase RecG [Acetobacteroides hydrogenigenes]